MVTKTIALFVYTDNAIFLLSQTLTDYVLYYYTATSVNTNEVYTMNTLFPVLTPLFLSKILAATILVVLLYNLFQTIRYGRKLAAVFLYPTDYLGKHREYAKRCFLVAVLAVLTVETIVRFLGEPLYDTLFWIHLSVFAIPCFVLLALIRFKYTGLHYPDNGMHSKLIYWGLLPTLVGTLLTGLPLLYRL